MQVPAALPAGRDRPADREDSHSQQQAVPLSLPEKTSGFKHFDREAAISRPTAKKRGGWDLPRPPLAARCYLPGGKPIPEENSTGYRRTPPN